MNIVLLGYRGTGKSTVGRLLANELKRKLVSLDEIIVQTAGKPVPRIVSEDGWPRFREMETQAVEKVTSSESNCVIDCGGGAILDARNTENLRRNGKTVLLTASFDAILKRIERDPNRPSLKEGISVQEEIKQTLAERQEKYLAAADFVCDTTRADPLKTAREIIAHFQQKGWI